MINSQESLASLECSELLARTRRLVESARCVEADLLLHLGEIDERKLYAEYAHPSMFVFCVAEYGFSEDAAYNRITVARTGRQYPDVIEALRSGRVHLGGLRLLAPHLTAENHREALAEASGKTKREIEELVVRIAPKPAAPPMIRKVPAPSPRPPQAEPFTLALDAAPTRPPNRENHRPAVSPLAEETYKIQFTASRVFRDKLRQAQELLHHRVPDGDLATVFEKALDVLIERVKKERFATGRRSRTSSAKAIGESSSRHIPDAIKREVYERDGGQCTFTDESERRCPERRGLEFDHVDGFALTHEHRPDRIRLLCRTHNQYVADKTYGRAFMERARSARASARPGTGRDASGPPVHRQ